MNTRATSARAALILAATLSIVALASACKTSSDPVSPDDGVRLQLDVVPLLLKADTLSTSTVWATLLLDGHPAPDSSAVYFLASPGTIDPVAYTRDGLAVAIYRAATEPGIAVIVAQAKAVRDTARITLY